MIPLFALILLSLAASPSWAGQGNLIKGFLLNTGVQVDARGKVEVVANKAQTFFMIKLKNLDPAMSYDILLNAMVVETVTPNAGGVAKVVHRERRKGQHGQNPAPLPYDPRGATLDVAISGGGATVLTGVIPATPGESRELIEITLDLLNTGIIAGEAEAEFKTRFGRMNFEVEMEDAPAGTYDLLVGGAVVGQIVVDALGEGEIEFDTIPDSGDDGDGLDLLMTFDPRGQAIEIRDPSVIEPLFTGLFPLAPLPL